MKQLGEYNLQDLKNLKNFRLSSIKKINLTTIKEAIILNKHAFILLYFFIYLLWFYILEQTITGASNYTVMHSVIDDYIPFNEFFLIPYYTWHPFMIITVIYFLITSKKDYLRACAMVLGGMTICCIIYTLFPSGQDLRPAVDTMRTNIFTDEIKRLYLVDTNTNVCPSIHVYDSVAACIIIWKSKQFNKNKIIKALAFIIAFFISISTVFVKQHSILDGFCALILASVMYVLVYKVNYNTLLARFRKNKVSKPTIK